LRSGDGVAGEVPPGEVASVLGGEQAGEVGQVVTGLVGIPGTAGAEVLGRVTAGPASVNGGGDQVVKQVRAQCCGVAGERPGSGRGR
jgi:hypothetical protein